jgi:ABC-2 type transport system ATP-binding protein
MAMILLDITGLNYRANNHSRWLFQGLQLTVNRGELVQVNGDSGSGKTTLAEIIGGWRKPASGTVRVTESVTLVSQIFSLYSDLTVGENIDFFNEINDGKFNKAAVLNWAGLNEMANIRADRLPLGYRRMLQIAVAIHRDFSLLILDDADSALDQNMWAKVMREFQNLKDAGKAILVLTSRPIADPVVDRLLLLRDGKVSECDALEHRMTDTRMEVRP